MQRTRPCARACAPERHHEQRHLRPGHEERHDEQHHHEGQQARTRVDARTGSGERRHDDLVRHGRQQPVDTRAVAVVLQCAACGV